MRPCFWAQALNRCHISVIADEPYGPTYRMFATRTSGRLAEQNTQRRRRGNVNLESFMSKKPWVAIGLVSATLGLRTTWISTFRPIPPAPRIATVAPYCTSAMLNTAPSPVDVAQPTIALTEGGKQVEKPAPRERYTHVRWTVLGSLASGAKVMAEFRSQVSEAPGAAK